MNKEELYNYIIDSQSRSNFNNLINTNRPDTPDFKSKEEFIETQIKFINDATDQDLKFLEVLKSKITHYNINIHDTDFMELRNLKCFFFDKNGQLVLQLDE